MTKKLTLSMDEEVIKMAKRLAAENNTTVSAMVASYVKTVGAKRKSRIPIAPIARKATGIVKLPKGKSDRDLITEALMDRYGLRK